MSSRSFGWNDDRVLRQPDRQTANEARDHCLLLFLYNTGARIGEALAVHQSDLQLSHPFQVNLHGKGRKERIFDALRAQATQQRLSLGEQPSPPKRRCAFLEGFSLHANTRVHENDRDNLRHLCAYGARGPLSLERLSSLPDGRVAYRMKRPASSGQTELLLEPLEFLRRLAALVPPPRVNLVRFFGLFAPNAILRKHLVPKPPKQDPSAPAAPSPASTPATKYRVPWAQLLRTCGSKRPVVPP